MVCFSIKLEQQSGLIFFSRMHFMRVFEFSRNERTHPIDVVEMFISSKLKIVVKSFGNGSQDICKCCESNLGGVAGFEG